MEKHNLEENLKIRSITGGCLHKKSLVFHIAHNEKYLQYVVNHISAQTISLRLVIKSFLHYLNLILRCLRSRWKRCSSTITLSYADCISRFIEVEERTTNHGTRTRFLRRFKNDAYSSPEMRNIQNFWIVNAPMNHWAGFTVDLDNSVLIDTYSKLSYTLI